VALEAEHDAGALETPLGDGVFADFGVGVAHHGDEEV
jgi:hypothetical protein